MISSVEPLISVILPVYNVRPYIEEAVDSVIHQTYENLEIILIDDGSTDGSADVCDRYGKDDARVRVIHQKNIGLSAARNTGLDICGVSLSLFLIRMICSVKMRSLQCMRRWLRLKWMSLCVTVTSI